MGKKVGKTELLRWASSWTRRDVRCFDDLRDGAVLVEVYAVAWPRAVERCLTRHAKAYRQTMAECPAFAAWDVLRGVFSDLMLPSSILDIEGAKAGRFKACYPLLALPYFASMLAHMPPGEDFACHFAHPVDPALANFLASPRLVRALHRGGGLPPPKGPPAADEDKEAHARVPEMRFVPQSENSPKPSVSPAAPKHPERRTTAAQTDWEQQSSSSAVAPPVAMRHHRGSQSHHDTENGAVESQGSARGAHAVQQTSTQTHEPPIFHRIMAEWAAAHVDVAVEEASAGVADNNQSVEFYGRADPASTIAMDVGEDVGQNFNTYDAVNNSVDSSLSRAESGDVARVLQQLLQGISRVEQHQQHLQGVREQQQLQAEPKPKADASVNMNADTADTAAQTSPGSAPTYASQASARRLSLTDLQQDDRGLGSPLSPSPMPSPTPTRGGEISLTHSSEANSPAISGRNLNVLIKKSTTLFADNPVDEETPVPVPDLSPNASFDEGPISTDLLPDMFTRSESADVQSSRLGTKNSLEDFRSIAKDLRVAATQLDSLAVQGQSSVAEECLHVVNNLILQLAELQVRHGRAGPAVYSAFSCNVEDRCGTAKPKSTESTPGQAGWSQQGGDLADSVSPSGSASLDPKVSFWSPPRAAGSHRERSASAMKTGGNIGQRRHTRSLSQPDMYHSTDGPEIQQCSAQAAAAGGGETQEAADADPAMQHPLAAKRAFWQAAAGADYVSQQGTAQAVQHQQHQQLLEASAPVEAISSPQQQQSSVGTGFDPLGLPDRPPPVRLGSVRSEAGSTPRQGLNNLSASEYTGSPGSPLPYTVQSPVTTPLAGSTSATPVRTRSRVSLSRMASGMADGDVLSHSWDLGTSADYHGGYELDVPAVWSALGGRGREEEEEDEQPGEHIHLHLHTSFDSFAHSSRGGTPTRRGSSPSPTHQQAMQDISQEVELQWSWPDHGQYAAGRDSSLRLQSPPQPALPAEPSPAILDSNGSYGSTTMLGESAADFSALLANAETAQQSSPPEDSASGQGIPAVQDALEDSRRRRKIILQQCSG